MKAGNFVRFYWVYLPLFWRFLALWVGGLWSPSYVNVFAQIGLVMLIGLTAKNAILIVEFAKTHEQENHFKQH